jgi:hypothetical protein
VTSFAWGHLPHPKLVLDCAVAFHNDYPSVGFVINSEVRGVLISWLREGILDLAIAEPGTEADLRATVIARDDLRVARRGGVSDAGTTR